MNRKTLVRKLAIPALVIFIFSIIGLIFEQPIRKAQNKKRTETLNEHIAMLTIRFQDFLNATAKQITGIPVDAHLVGKFQSDLLKDNPSLKLYLWLSDVNGNFIFGAPAAVFLKLNKGFEMHRDKILSEGYYMDQNDFLMKLVDLHDLVDFSEFVPKEMDKEKSYWWRTYRESRRLSEQYNFPYHNDYSRPTSFILSAPVSDAMGTSIGNLYLKVDDSYNHELYYSEQMAHRTDIYSILEPLFGAMTALAGLFLWFIFPTWVYIDAKQRDVKNPGVWAFFTLISFIIFGLTIYLITRPAALKTFHCPQCENELNGSKAYCPYCGYDLSSTFCPQCQYPIKQDWGFCPNCRAQLKQQKILQLKEKKNSKKKNTIENEQ